MIAGRFALVALILVAAACENQDPASPGPLFPTSVTDVFSGTLAPNAFVFYSFPVFEDGLMRVTLASVTDGATGPAISPTLKLGLGVPSGIDCATFTEVTAQPALQPQIDGFGLSPGTYCVRLADAGSLARDGVFAVKMVYPNQPNIEISTPKAETFASNLAVSGASSRTLVATQSGTLTVSLEGLGNSVARVGLGVGILSRVDNTCRFTRSLETGPGGGPHIVLGVVSGEYCVRIYDVGLLTAPTSFSINLTWP